ncbi:thyroid stimulating hormone subunit beta a [Megalops cyprinoides]|uniref:thyroid stimulating hormone subunit beta a n=1 Tax=Megalops cyprinoides TaxID=118141 RepID=UPI001863D8A9|nr:thyroid stimulating hormone subunit beta a [Megalops cyprinoides]
MDTIMLTGGLLCLLVGQALSTCDLTDYTIYVEKPECDFCVAINTTICMGFCRSRDTNVMGLAGTLFLVQRSCTYQSLEYRTAVLPGCPLHVDPLFSYPVALRCNCSTCDTDRSECTHKAVADGARCSKPLRHIYPYPGESNHIQSH